MIKNPLNSPQIIFLFSKQTVGRWRVTAKAPCFILSQSTLFQPIRMRVIYEFSHFRKYQIEIGKFNKIEKYVMFALCTQKAETGGGLFSYCPISCPSLVTVPEVFAKVNSIEFPSRFQSGECWYVIVPFSSPAEPLSFTL